MGRRALRKTDPSLELSGHLKSFDDLPRPWNVEALFGRGGPVEVDVGSGKGLFLRSAAAAWPKANFLGIEMAAKYARFAAAALAKRGLENARVVNADAARVFAEVFPNASLAAVHVYFPDPWWKKRHAKRRIVRESFVRDVERALVPGGLLHLWTDVEDYFRYSLEVLAKHTSLEGPEDEPELPAEHDLDYRTHFERRMRLHNERVFRARFRKAAT